ncbi:arginine kinase-like [Pecten maximus]|uniref:arginine kinase-like n=1 Tax=Pecten maximus TaxID=6579 RepID=UPI0014582CF3|nr:arginine kinase-like [Pecten maximus]XP_033742329.1 arginine kinase-like [Pecten maximus]
MSTISVEDHWNRLKHAQSTSFLKRNMTELIFRELKDKLTYFNGTLLDCIQGGCINLDSGCGIYASDPEAYDVFSGIFHPIIKDYHKVDTVSHPNPDFGDINNLGFGDLDPTKRYITSTRVRVGRSQAGFPFHPTAKLKDRVELESRAKEALDVFSGELDGSYYPLSGMSREKQTELIEEHYLYLQENRFLGDAHVYDDWPVGRGIFYNPDKTFLVWVNEEDHLRFISMQKGSDLGAVYKRLVTALNTIEEKSSLKFGHHSKLGYLTFCPSNLGTTLRASVHIRIPCLASQPYFHDFLEKHHLQVRGVNGVHTEMIGDIYDISNKRRLGLTEIQAVREMIAGVGAVLAEEQRLDGSITHAEKQTLEGRVAAET